MKEFDRKKDAKNLYDKARKALENAYAPYSNYYVGAAILTSDGRIYTGANIENSAFGAGICAERVAASKAISEGHKTFIAIAVAGEKGEAVPCGICRQFLSEFSPEMIVITCAEDDNSDDKLKITELNELLPSAFKLEEK